MVAITLRQVFRFSRTLIWEKYYPQVFAVVAAIAAWYFDLMVGGEQSLLLTTTVTFGAIVFGFVGTSLSILTSLGTTVMQRIRQTDYIYALRRYLGWGLGSGALLSCVSIIGLLLNPNEQMFANLWCGVMVFCLACLYRLARMMLRIFSDSENLP